jgi:hypothetical protein
LLQHGGKRPQERRGCSGFYCSLEEGLLERVAPLVFGFLQRREFPGEQTVWFLLQKYSNYAEHLKKPVYFLWRYSFQAEHYVRVLLCGKSILLEEIQD